LPFSGGDCAAFGSAVASIVVCSVSVISITQTTV
jgi:hypothetical protein